MDDLNDTLLMIARCHQHQWPEHYGRALIPAEFPVEARGRPAMLDSPCSESVPEERPPAETYVPLPPPTSSYSDCC